MPPKRQSVEGHLSDARAAIASGDFSTGLAQLLDAWKQRPIAPIADAIDVVGHAAANRMLPPSGKTPKARREAWDALFAEHDPASTTLLLVHVCETRFGDTAGRLARFDDGDPRVAQRIADLLEAPPYNPEAQPETWTALFDKLAASRDPRLLDRVRGFEAKWQASRELTPWRMGNLVDNARTTLATLAKRAQLTPTPAETAACAALTTAIPTTQTPTDEAPLAAIYEDPDGDAPRAVYMDWLLEREDPRGEFIRLQLASQRSPKEAKLLKQYEVTWLGRLADKIKPKTTRWERGFLVECELREPHYTLDDDPAWATVRTVRGGVPGGDRCHARALREVTEVDARGLETLAKLTTPFAIEELAWSGPMSWDFDPAQRDFTEDGRTALAALERIRVLPRLRKLVLQGHAWRPEPDATAIAEIERVLRAPVGANLETLAVPVLYPHVPRYLRHFEASRLARLELSLGSSGPMWPRAVFAICERGPDNRFSRICFSFSLRDYNSAIHYSYGHEAVGVLDNFDDPTWLHQIRILIPRAAESTAKTQLRKPLATALARHTHLATKPTIEYF